MSERARPREDLPLGVFDSGLGGLTVVRALRAALPHERVLYLGDTARVPYGTRSAETVVRYARSCARMLTKRGVKAIVVACNTVSAVALDMLRTELDLPVLGVIEPGASAALAALQRVARSPSEPLPKIGVLGTQGTVNSGAYPRALARLTTRVEVVSQAAPLLVPLVEEGWLDGPVPRLAVERYVAPLLENGARVIVLGCTHYPLLAPIVREVAERLSGAEVPVVDSALATADHLLEWVRADRVPRASEPPAGAEPSLELFVTDLPGSFGVVAGRFLGGELPEVHQVDLET